MSRLFSIIIFLVYKSAEVYISYQAIQYFKLRTDNLILLFYCFLSLFQFLFVLFQSLTGIKKRLKNGVFFQYTTIITIIMDFVILLISGYYLFNQENDIYKLFLIFTLFTPLHTIFYFVHGLIFSLLLRKKKIMIRHISILPIFLFMLVCFGTPVAYLLVKTIIHHGLSLLDILMLSFIFCINVVILFLIFVYKALKARKIGSLIKSMSVFIQNDLPYPDDPNEFGFIQTELLELNKRIMKDKESISLFSDYISQNMRSEISKKGVPSGIEELNATVSTVIFHILNTDLTPEVYFKIYNSISVIIGEYADEYEAYPVFQHQKAVVVYGAPIFYEHHKYNAIEASQRTIEDIEKLADAENVRVDVFIGIYSGNVMAGMLNTKGKKLKEYAILGEGIIESELIATEAENSKSRILVSDKTLDNLKTKFKPDKSYIVNLKSGREITVHQIRV